MIPQQLQVPPLLAPPAAFGGMGTNRNTGVSIASTARIEAHLKAGNPLFIDVDREADGSKCPNAQHTPSSASCPPSARSFSTLDDSTSKRAKESSKFLRILTFGIPVDGAARAVLLIAFCQGALGLFTGIDNFSQSQFIGQKQIIIAGTMVAFGLFIMCVCLNGFTLMWSTSYRRSPTAATVFMVNCILTMILMSASTFLWIFYAAKPVDCSAVIIPTGRFRGVFVHAGDNPGFRQNPICLRFRDNLRRIQLFWGTILGVTAYFFVVLAFWAVHYRRRVLLARLLEEAEGEDGDEVGLVIAKAPMGRESPLTSPGSGSLGYPYAMSESEWSPGANRSPVDLERAYRGSYGSGRYT